MKKQKKSNQLKSILPSKIKIGIIGAGNMGSAFYHGLLKNFNRDQLFIADHDLKKLQLLKTKNISTDFNQILKKVDMVILAIKPQSLEDFVSQLQIKIDQKIVISIMAGISLSKLKKATRATKIIRSMPNLPAKVGQGFTAWICTKNVTGAEQKIAEKIFASMGQQTPLKNEKMLDAITALSASGPAYFFYLCELLSKKALQLGFTKLVADQIAHATFIGAAELLKKSHQDAASWRQAVTSKGGTTQAALESMAKNRFDTIFHKAIDAAKKRSEQLNKNA